jgi:hypothetical protein
LLCFLRKAEDCEKVLRQSKGFDIGFCWSKRAVLVLNRQLELYSIDFACIHKSAFNGYWASGRQPFQRISARRKRWMHAFVAGAMYGPAAQKKTTGEALSLLSFHQPSTNLNASSILNFYRT